MNEYQHVESDRLGLLQIAVELITALQPHDAAIERQLEPSELKAYNQALKLLEKEFNKGPSPAETVIVKARPKA